MHSEARKRQVPAPAAAPLTEQERAELRDVTEQHFMVTDIRRSPLRCSCGRWHVEDPGAPWPGFRAHFAMHNRLAVERILAARLAEQREQIAVEVREFALDVPCYGSRGETRMVDVSVEGLAADLYHLIRKTPRSGRAR